MAILAYMTNSSLSSLYEAYKEARPTTLMEEQFTPFVVFFPALLVSISDGVIDCEEWDYLQQLARFMAKPFGAGQQQDSPLDSEAVNDLSKLYLTEIAYIIKHLPLHQEAFLNGLKAYLAQNPSIKASVLETIELFAEASDGTSEQEAEKIKYLTHYLELPYNA